MAMKTMEKALERVRELLNYKEVNFDNICVSYCEISKVDNADAENKIVLYRAKDTSDEKYRELMKIISCAWQIRFNEMDMEKILKGEK